MNEELFIRLNMNLERIPFVETLECLVRFEQCLREKDESLKFKSN